MPATRASAKARLSQSQVDPASAELFSNLGNTDNVVVAATVQTSPETESVQEPGVSDDPNVRRKRRALNWEKDNRPPRPANAFISFKSALKDGPLKREYAARLATGENIGVIAQQMWKGLGEDERDKWYAAAKKAKVEHSKKYPDYKYQPQKRKDKKKARRRKVSDLEQDDDYVDDDGDEAEENSDDVASGVGHGEETGTTSAFTPSSELSNESDIKGDLRLIEVYTGGSENLDRLYEKGWKWALVRDYEPPAAEAALDLDEKNPIVHLQAEGIESSANPLAVELISLSSVLNNVDSGPDTPSSMNLFTTGDPALFQQMFSPWDFPPPHSSSFFHDGQPALEASEGSMKPEAST